MSERVFPCPRKRGGAGLQLLLATTLTIIIIYTWTCQEISSSIDRVACLVEGMNVLVTVRCVLMLLCLLSTEATLSKKDKKKGKKDADKVRRSIMCICHYLF